MVTRSEKAAGRKPKKFLKRFRSIGLRSLLLLVTVACVIFASEANHHFHQRKVIEQLSKDDWLGEVRYSWLASDHLRWLDRVFGPNWNLDVATVTLNSLEVEQNHLLLQHLAKLGRLRIISIHYGAVAKSDVERFKHMHSLQWLGLIECGVDRESVIELRKKLPNTYVSHIP